jgi:hypothetical protein
MAAFVIGLLITFLMGVYLSDYLMFSVHQLFGAVISVTIWHTALNKLTDYVVK